MQTIKIYYHGKVLFVAELSSFMAEGAYNMLIKAAHEPGIVLEIWKDGEKINSFEK